MTDLLQSQAADIAGKLRQVRLRIVNDVRQTGQMTNAFGRNMAEFVKMRLLTTPHRIVSDKQSDALKAELKRRSAIEPVIGHIKADHRMGRNHLKTRSGDRFNVKMAAIGFNFRRILKWLEALVLWLMLWMWANAAGSRKMAVC